MSVGDGDDGKFDLLRRRTGGSGGEGGRCFLLRCKDGFDDESESDGDEATGASNLVLEWDELESDEELSDSGEWGLSRVLCNTGGEGSLSRTL